MFEAVGKVLLEQGVFGITTILFVILFLRERKEVNKQRVESNKHIDARIKLSEKVIVVINEATVSVNKFGDELHEGLEAVAETQETILEKLAAMEKTNGS